MPAFLLAVAVVLLCWGIADDHDKSQDYAEQVAKFTYRCNEKGGTVLYGERNTGGWLGCFQVKELENE